MQFWQIFQFLSQNPYCSQSMEVFTSVNPMKKVQHKNLLESCDFLANLVRNTQSSSNILLLMAECSLNPRKQRINQLIATLSIESPPPTRPLYLIDRSFHHTEIEHMTAAEKRIVNHTIDLFAQREQRQLEQQLHARQKSAAQAQRRKLVQSMRNFQESNSLHFFPSRKKPKRINLTFPQHHIFLERKYNSQMAYQLQSFLQGRRIQEDRSKLKRQGCPQPPPLLIEALKRVRHERATVGSNHDSNFPSNGPSIHQQFKDQKLNKSIKKAVKQQKSMKDSIRKQHISYNSIQKQIKNKIGHNKTEHIRV